MKNRYIAPGYQKDEQGGRKGVLTTVGATLSAAYDRRRDDRYDWGKSKPSCQVFRSPSNSKAASPLKVTKTTKTTFFEARSPKVACTVDVSNGTTLKVSAVRAADGERFVVVRQKQRTAVTRLHSWHAGSAVASKILADHDIILVDGLSDLRSAVAKLARFEDYPVITRPGWSGDTFTLADGQTFQPETARRALMAFAPTPGAFASGGSLKGWRAKVAKPLADHSLASFMLMVMFAAPILRFSNRVDNFGFEIAGPAGRGKSTLQLLMASAAGPSIGGDGTTYWSSCNATINALETVISSRSDMTLILDEAGSLPNSAKADARGDAMRELAFRLSSGQVRQRHGKRQGPTFRLVYVISTNRPLASMISRNHSAEAQAIADRLMTLPLATDRPHGVFDLCPEQYPTTGAFADALRQAASDHYGHALPAFLRFLVRQLSKNPDRLRRFITDYTEKFIADCGADLNDGSQRRVAEAFGLVAAAGALAKRAGVLPQSYKPRVSALACYELHRSQGRLTRSFDDQLRSLIQHPDTIDLADHDSKLIPLDTLQACKVFLRTGRSGNRELLVPRKFRDAVYTNWNVIRHGSEVIRRLKLQKGRNVSNRKIADGINGPFYCFDVAGLE